MKNWSQPDLVAVTLYFMSFTSQGSIHLLKAGHPGQSKDLAGNQETLIRSPDNSYGAHLLDGCLTADQSAFTHISAQLHSNLSRPDWQSDLCSVID